MSLACLILGATGETGKYLLLDALANPAFKTVHALGRRNPAVDPATPGFEKLVTTLLDFDALLDGDATEAAKLKKVDADVVLITMGTTREAAGSAEAFVKIDKDFVLAAAKAARIDYKAQKLVYCSSGHASSTTPFLFPQSKGLTEEGLVELGYHECIIFRPGLLVVPGGRKEHRFLESIAVKITGYFDRMSYLFPALHIHTPVLAAAIVRAAVEGADKLTREGLGVKEDLKGHDAWIVWNKEARQLEGERVGGSNLLGVGGSTK